MIEINLLPLELREKKKTRFEQIFRTKVLLFVLGSLILFHLFLISLNAINTKRLVILKKTWQNLSFKREHLEQLKGQLDEINTRMPLIGQLIKGRVLWSEKLNRISDSIINGIWLNEISLKRQKAKTKGASLEYLIIQGSAVSPSKDEPALIGRFMQNLKDDSSFSADFVEIELGPIKKRKIAQTEIMDFVLICWFKRDKT